MIDETWFLVGEVIRVISVLLGFGAMWALWVAKDRRGHRWTSKMKDIWLCHILFVAASIEANITHLWRGTFPTAATLLIGFICLWTIKGAFNGDMYTKDDCDHREE